MSVKIDTIEATTLTTGTTGLLRTSPDPTTFATTCSQIKNYISSLALFALNFNATSAIVGTWSSILTNEIKTANTSATNIRGTEIKIGGPSTTINVLGNTLNVSSTFPTVLSGIINMGRIQAGYVTVTALGASLITPPIVPSGTYSVHVMGTINGIVAINGANATGFNIGTQNVPQEVNWIHFC